MAVRKVKSGAGWSGIEAALAGAAAGDRVVLAPEIYDGERTLRLGAGVALQGEGATLRFTGDGPAIEARNVADVTLTDLTLEVLQPGKRSILPDDPPDKEAVPEWGLVWFDGVESGQIERVTVRVASDDGKRTGIVLRLGNGTVVRESTVKGARRGLALCSATGAIVDRCIIANNDLNGIQLFRSLSRLDCPANALIMATSSHDNEGAGIVLFSSWADRIEECDVWGNGQNGIALDVDPKTSNEPSRANLRAIRSHGNGYSGISLHSSDAEWIEDCDVWGNGLQGISLARSERNLEAPSHASLRGIRSHDNVWSGISVTSSEANRIEDCDVWGNGSHGIILQRDEQRPEAPSQAALINARCHDNGIVGIGIGSSFVERIEGCECWGNGSSGIELNRNDYSLDAESHVTLINARCHDNGLSGLAIFSSSIELIEDCDFWGNGKNGVALMRNAKSRDAPSRASIHATRSHDNAGEGILVLSSEADRIEGCDVWGNGFNGITLQRDKDSPDSLSRAHLHATCSHNNSGRGLWLEENRAGITFDSGGGLACWGNGADSGWLRPAPDGFVFAAPVDGIVLPSDDDKAAWKAAQLDRASHGELARKLEEDGLPRSERLARFLDGSGCLGCLADWWPGEFTDTPDRDIIEHTRRYRGRIEPDGEGIAFAVEPDAAALDRLWDCIHDAARARMTVEGGYALPDYLQKSGTDRIGIIATGEGIETLKHDAATIAALLSGETGDANTLSAPARRAAAMMQEHGARLAPPLVLDHSSRSASALTGEARPRTVLGEAELLEGRKPWAERVRLLLATPTLWGRAVLWGAVVFIAAVGFGHWKGFPGGWNEPLGAALHAVRSAVNDLEISDIGFLIGLPLALFTGLLLTLNAHLPSSLKMQARIFGRTIPADPEGTDVPGSPWRRWAASRLYAGDIALLIIRNAREWSDADCQALAELIEAKPKGSHLVVALQAESRTLVSRALLMPLSKEENGQRSLDGLDGLELVVEEDAPPLAPVPSEELLPLARLLGLEVTGHDADIRGAFASLADPGWGVADILPMLVIGSTPEARFELSRFADEDPRKYMEGFAEAILPYARFIEGGEVASLDRSDDEAVRKLSRQLWESRAVLVFEGRANKRQTSHYLGRPAMRQALTDALTETFGTTGEEARRAYVATLLGCGQLHAWDRLASLGRDGPETAERLADAVGLLASVERLDAERAAFAPLGDVREAMLAEAKREAAEALAQVEVEREEEATLEGARLWQAAGRLGLLDPLAPFTADAHATSGLLVAPVRRLTEQHPGFDHLDPHLASMLAKGALMPERQQMKEETAQVLDRWLGTLHTQGEGLAERLAAVESEQDVVALLEAHLPLGRTLVSTVYANLPRLLPWQENSRHVAQLLRAHVERGVVFPRGNKPLGLTQQQATSPSALVSGLTSDRAIAALEQASLRVTGVDQTTRPDVTLGSFEPLQGIMQRKLRIILGSAVS